MNHICKSAAMACLAVVLGACSNTALIRSTHPQTHLTLKDHAATRLPTRLDLSTTTFGNYEFEAVQPGQPPMYGLLPLNFQGGNLALDILFFMPAIWFNLRGAYEHYEVDVENGVIRYRDDNDDPWQTYRPTPQDIASARQQFGAAAAARAVPAVGNASVPSPSADPARPAPDSGHYPTHASEGTVCDTRRTGIICPDDPSRHTQSH